tara:strand:- start:111 stop:269 length:159 start_codon:yes stop_codon:yes gene_type:complete
MLEMAMLESIVSQPIKLEMAMFYVNTFFIIIATQMSFLVYTLYNEKGDYNER